MVDIRSILAFNASSTKEIKDFEEIDSIVEMMIKLYHSSYGLHNFSFRILLPRMKDSQKINNESKKMGFKIQNDFLLGIRKLKLKPNVREFRYIHDENHFGWLLIDPSFYETL
ncbi:MAG TPA: hypothetical protein VN704_13705 [Verrucomicrobiae bacterium]|nr:hypothetical protein [Verrucomicrobiae bacterium]